MTVINLGLIFKNLVFLEKELASISETEMFQPILKSVSWWYQFISVLRVSVGMQPCFQQCLLVIMFLKCQFDSELLTYSSVFCPGFSVL